MSDDSKKMGFVGAAVAAAAIGGGKVAVETGLFKDAAHISVASLASHPATRIAEQSMGGVTGHAFGGITEHSIGSAAGHSATSLAEHSVENIAGGSIGLTVDHSGGKVPFPGFDGNGTQSSISHSGSLPHTTGVFNQDQPVFANHIPPEVRPPLLNHGQLVAGDDAGVYPNITQEKLHLTAVGDSADLNYKQKKAASFFYKAEPHIINDIKAHRNSITQEELEALIRSEVTKAISATQNEKGSGIKFEVMSGKLTITGEKKLAGVSFTGGDINVYKISATIAGPMYACKMLIGADLEKCVNNAMKLASSAIAEEIKKSVSSNTTDEKSK